MIFSKFALPRAVLWFTVGGIYENTALAGGG